VKHILGHKGSNSLLSYLEAKNLAKDISANVYHCLNDFSIFCLWIDLTEKGMSEYQNVLEITFGMIQVIQKEQVAKHVFDEY